MQALVLISGPGHRRRHDRGRGLVRASYAVASFGQLSSGDPLNLTKSEIHVATFTTRRPTVRAGICGRVRNEWSALERVAKVRALWRKDAVSGAVP
jgi:hypothetical protein